MDIQDALSFHPAHPQENSKLWSCGTATRGNYTGLSVQKAVDNVNTKIAEAILGENALNQTYIDSLLVQTDGTDNKSNLGANASLGVSMAVARAAAMALRIPLYQYIGGCHACRMPVPMMNILNGGACVIIMTQGRTPYNTRALAI